MRPGKERLAACEAAGENILVVGGVVEAVRDHNVASGETAHWDMQEGGRVNVDDASADCSIGEASAADSSLRHMAACNCCTSGAAYIAAAAVDAGVDAGRTAFLFSLHLAAHLAQHDGRSSCWLANILLPNRSRSAPNWRGAPVSNQ